MSEFEKWYGSNFGDPYDAPKDRYKAMQEAFKAGALTARSEGFREGVEAAARVCEKRVQALSEDPDNGYVEGDTNAFIWTNLEAEYVADELDEAAEAIRALSPRETDADTQVPQDAAKLTAEQVSRANPAASAPSGEVAEMVKRLRAYANESGGARVEQDLLQAATLLSKVGQSARFKWGPHGMLAYPQGGYIWIDTPESLCIGCQQPEYCRKNGCIQPPPPERP